MNTAQSRHRRREWLQAQRNATAAGRTAKKHSQQKSELPNASAWTPDRLPDPWLLDSEWLLNELAQLRELALRVPCRADTYQPTNTIVDRIWRLEGTLRHLIHLQREGQRAFGQKAKAKPAPELKRRREASA